MGKFLLVLVALGAVGVGFGAYLWYYNTDRRSDEQIALEVTREWTVESIDNIATSVAGLAVGRVLGLTDQNQDQAAGVIGDQIPSRVTWTADWPRCSRSISQCDVTVTARGAVPIPFIDQTATVLVPFILSVDTGNQRVDDWDPDISSASVSVIEAGDVMSGAGDIGSVIDSVLDSVWQDIDSVSQPRSAGDIREAFWQDIDSVSQPRSAGDIREAFEAMDRLSQSWRGR